MMEINRLDWGNWPWCIICPGLPTHEQYARTEWCMSQNMNFHNSGVRFWFTNETDVIMFRLRWS